MNCAVLSTATLADAVVIDLSYIVLVHIVQKYVFHDERAYDCEHILELCVIHRSQVLSRPPWILVVWGPSGEAQGEPGSTGRNRRSQEKGREI